VDEVAGRRALQQSRAGSNRSQALAAASPLREDDRASNVVVAGGDELTAEQRTMAEDVRSGAPRHQRRCGQRKSDRV